MSKYKLEFREYLCHPETCCHNEHLDWWITKDGDWLSGFPTKIQALSKLSEFLAEDGKTKMLYKSGDRVYYEKCKYEVDQFFILDGVQKVFLRYINPKASFVTLRALVNASQIKPVVRLGNLKV